MKVVFDTNAVLDWLLFDGAAARSIDTLMREQALVAVTNAACLAELERVLRYPKLRVAEEKRNAVLSAYRSWTQIDAASPVTACARCRDRDDQKFLDLAVTAQATFVVSHDARVLGLARCMQREHEVQIVTIAGLERALARNVA